MSALMGNAHIFTKVNVPKYMFLLSKNVQTLINFGITLVVFLVFCVLDKVYFTWKFLMLIYPIACLMIFNIGVGLVLSAMFVFFRDIQNIWSVVTLAWMYLTPIFYTLDSMSPVLRYWIPKVNPMYIYITQMRDFVLNGGWPWTVLIWRGALVAAIMVALGMFVFTKAKDKFILYI